MSQDRAATTFPQSASSQEHKCCILCGNKGTQLSNYSNWGAIEKEFLHTHLDRYPPEGSYICKKHWIEAQRHHTNSHYIPKWKEVHTQEPQKCCIHPQCCNKFHEKSRLTVVSREAKKKQHACASSGLRDHYSELFTRMAALKF